MESTRIIGVLVALVCGLAVGVQTTLFTQMGQSVGPPRASLLVNVVGGTLGGLIFVALLGVQGRDSIHIPTLAWRSALIAALMGLFLIMGVSFSLQRIGIAAGLATLFLGQMLTAAVIDTLGWLGAEAIPLDPRRAIGLLITGAGVMLLLPRN